MKKEEFKGASKAVRYFKISAIAVWPIGVVLGLMISAGQDAAGAGIGFAMGIAFALFASVFFGFLCWFCKSKSRVHFVSQNRRNFLLIISLGTAAYIVWYAKPLFEDQHYSVSVTNRSSHDLLNVEVRFSGIAIQFDHIQAGATIVREGFEKRPTGETAMSWIDDEGNQQTITGGSVGGPPRRYDGGELSVTFFSQYNISAYFTMPPRR